MTPMVDLGFLLITFFIFTSTMQQPTTTNLLMPNEHGEPSPVKQSGALTILPDEAGKIYYYEGIFTQGNVHTSSLAQIRNVIVAKKKRTPEKDFFVVIKPAENSNYGHIINILDEMKISDVKRYALANFSQEEKEFFE